MIRILMADDHAIVRTGVRLILEGQPDMTVAREVDNGDDALREIMAGEWDLVILDISMPGRGAMEVLQAARRDRPGLPILILTTHDDPLMAMGFLQAGAGGYVTKDSSPDVLTGAVRKIVAGQKTVSEDLAGRVLSAWDSDPRPHERLSPREYVVFLQLVAGKTVTQIAGELKVNPRTVSTFRVRILKKMNVKDNFELTTYALKHGLIR